MRKQVGKIHNIGTFYKPRLRLTYIIPTQNGKRVIRIISAHFLVFIFRSMIVVSLNFRNPFRPNFTQVFRKHNVNCGSTCVLIQKMSQKVEVTLLWYLFSSLFPLSQGRKHPNGAPALGLTLTMNPSLFFFTNKNRVVLSNEVGTYQ